ncbi:esterase FE4-like [Pectinophora gossypiella]|uniref:esterase FE4-like n=1 Tax=Pectinophora gossypiella TaxID=13191 RepID=UPI00214EF25C|nr:esterase FE4-like [Pectinophora gossypiella]XP_049878151.1 esterase FE4-like [Pectinophora gossypiella]
MLRIGVICLLVAIHVVAIRDKSPFRNRDCRVVSTEAGPVRGCETDNNVQFLGVPYAAPPIGPRRFKAPARPFSWKGIYDADRVVKCPQKGKGVEDCLVVNIFTPIRMLKAPLPVLVYIHGGSFLMGSGQVTGVDPLIEQNMIVVTVNYRLGALGFLCLGIEEAPGNAGLKDQVAALSWVQRNIGNFGGDPNQVTVYGMSAGGASVEYLVLSKQTKGLFKRAIVESGSATSLWAADSNPISTAYEVAKNLKFPVLNPHELVSYYQRVPANKLSKVNYEYYNNLTDGTFGFVPCVEKKLGDGSEAFITESAYNLLTKEKYNKVPMMFFFASVEGLFLRSSELYEEGYKEKMTANFQDFLPGDLVVETPEIRTKLAEIIKDFYFSNKTIGEDLMDYLNYFGDYMILHGLLNSAEKHSKCDNLVYLMEFAYKGNMGSYEKFYENISSAGHGDVIKHVILNRQPQSKHDKLAVNRIAKIVANFVKYGNPIPEYSDILPILWPVVRPGNGLGAFSAETRDSMTCPGAAACWRWSASPNSASIAGTSTVDGHSLSAAQYRSPPTTCTKGSMSPSTIKV